MADLPIQRIGPTGPAVTGTPSSPTTKAAPPPVAASAAAPVADTASVQTMLGAIAQAVADLPPGTALAVFLAAVQRVTAEVERQLADAAVPTPAVTIADPSRLPSTLAEVSQRDLALAAALIAGRLVPDARDPLPPVAVAADDHPMMEPTMRDRLYLLAPTFADPALPGRIFYCRDCVTVDGLLALFPDAARRIDVIRIDYPRPRAAVIDAIGVANQNLPVLVLADDADPALADGRHGKVRFVGDIGRLLHALHVRHGFPEAHP